MNKLRELLEHFEILCFRGSMTHEDTKTCWQPKPDCAGCRRPASWNSSGALWDGALNYEWEQTLFIALDAGLRASPHGLVDTGKWLERKARERRIKAGAR